MRGLFVAFIVVFAACAVGPRPPPAPPRRTSLGIRIQTVTLGNGLRVVLVNDPKATELQVTMQYGVGAADDPPGQTGMAHLVEHLMFQQVLGSQTLFAQLESVTTSFNAFTSLDTTFYFSRADASHLDKLLAVEAVRLGFRCTTITDSAFAREREVVIQEIGLRDDAAEVIAAIQAGLYPAGHPYGRTVGGNAQTVGAITMKDACAFADAHYAPSNAVLVISGSIEPQQIEAALGKFVARIAARHVAKRAPIAAATRGHDSPKVKAPIDDDVVMYAWPLPLDPLKRARALAIAHAVGGMIDGKVSGAVSTTLVGDERAPMLAVLVERTQGESLLDLHTSVRVALEELPVGMANIRLAALGDFAFDRVQQSAIYQLYASLDEAMARDVRLASYAISGRDPNEALAAEFAGIRDMSPQNAATLASELFTFQRATIVELEPSREKRNANVPLRPAVHDLGLRRADADPQQAFTAARAKIPALAGMTTRKLANGLSVVLLPVTSVPTVDIRLVFGAGTADEPPDRRGTAIVAARGLGWNLRYFNDLFKFAAAGGTDDVDVGRDYTTFAARGVDMHLDVLLAGLRRWVREGVYDDAVDVVQSMRDERKQLDDEGVTTDALRAAMYGSYHPYVLAGIPRHASPRLGVEDAERFRASNFTPDNATLVIAGRFDPALADKWIDYLFADWRGSATPRTKPPVTAPGPATLAKIEDLVQMQLLVRLPAVAGSRAQREVAAAMLDEIGSDVRHQLGASYGLDGDLYETRLATHYGIDGWIDAARTGEAMKLLRERLVQLTADQDAAARAFVRARERVLTRLVSTAGSATTISTRVARDVGLERAPLSDLETAQAVRALTIDGMAPVLAELDLARAVVFVRGRDEAIKNALAAVERTPTYIKFDQAAADKLEDPFAEAEALQRRETEMPDEIEDAITETAPSSKSGLAISVSGELATASIAYRPEAGTEDCCLGARASVGIGKRFDRKNAVGVQLSLGLLTGTLYSGGVANPIELPAQLVPLDVRALFLTSPVGRFWGGLTLGPHFEWETIEDRFELAETKFHFGVGLGLHGGIDLFGVGAHRFGIVAAVDGALSFGSSTGYGAATIGVAYRR